jgi:tripartite-type tricarboxylate transporter receptor subunit TctC
MQAAIANDIQILVDTPLSLMPQVRSGKLRALGMFSDKRLLAYADVPTFAEAGGPALESSTWVLFMAPGATPREIVNRLASEAAKAVRDSEVQDRLAQAGIDPVGNTPEQAKRFLDAEIAKWAKVITAAGVKPEQ